MERLCDALYQMKYEILSTAARLYEKLHTKGFQ